MLRERFRVELERSFRLDHRRATIGISPIVDDERCVGIGIHCGCESLSLLKPQSRLLASLARRNLSDSG